MNQRHFIPPSPHTHRAVVVVGVGGGGIRLLYLFRKTLEGAESLSAFQGLFKRKIWV